MATRRRFTQEYKEQAVSLVLDSGRSIAEVASRYVKVNASVKVNPVLLKRAIEGEYPKLSSVVEDTPIQ